MFQSTQFRVRHELRSGPTFPFGLPCRVGLPKGLSGLATLTEGPEYAGAVGMVRYAFRTTAQRERPVKVFRSLFSRLFGR